MEVFKVTLLLAFAIAFVPTGCRGCACLAMYKPICGTNGKTYSNECNLKCDMKYSPTLRKAHRGKCKMTGQSQSLPHRPCGCSGQWDPVCGSDNKTYNNRACFLCALKKRGYGPRKFIECKGPCPCENKRR